MEGGRDDSIVVHSILVVVTPNIDVRVRRPHYRTTGGTPHDRILLLKPWTYAAADAPSDQPKPDQKYERSRDQLGQSRAERTHRHQA